MASSSDQKHSKREKLFAKAEELYRKHQKDGSPDPASGAYSSNDKKDLLKKAQELLNKNKDQKEHDKKGGPEHLALAALGALGPVAYAMWKKKKAKKKRQGHTRQGQNNETQTEEEEQEEEGAVEEEEEHGGGFEEFLTWIQETFAE